MFEDTSDELRDPWNSSRGFQYASTELMEPFATLFVMAPRRVYRTGRGTWIISGVKDRISEDLVVGDFSLWNAPVFDTAPASLVEGPRVEGDRDDLRLRLEFDEPVRVLEFDERKHHLWKALLVVQYEASQTHAKAVSLRLLGNNIDINAEDAWFLSGDIPSKPQKACGHITSHVGKTAVSTDGIEIGAA